MTSSLTPRQVIRGTAGLLATTAVGILLIMAIAPSTTAQTFTVIHNFTGQGDGEFPIGGITLDRAGNLYGTTNSMSQRDPYGTIFAMKKMNGSWILNTLFQFDYYDGWQPMGRVTFGPDGALYGVTFQGGGCTVEHGCGVLFRLQPMATSCKTAICSWTQTASYSFQAGNDGFYPFYVDPVFDSTGHIYGTTSSGGSSGYGTVFQATPSHGGLAETVLYNFPADQSVGTYPFSGVVADSAGNLYGTTGFGGANNNGAVYRLTHSGSGWTGTALYSFAGAADGMNPVGPPLVDPAGNVYGTTAGGGPNGGGTVFELSPSGQGWTFILLYAFTGPGQGSLPPGLYGPGPSGNLIMDPAGNLYGTTSADGLYGYGSAFMLSRTNGRWIYTSLHDFTGGADGGGPTAGLTRDSSGNLYGTAGNVFEIMP
jgi:uncharacterized repeat protein (TIGR03803 family)